MYVPEDLQIVTINKIASNTKSYDAMTMSTNKRHLMGLFLLCIMLTGCVTRPPALPEEYARELPWGAIELDINKHGPFTLRDSLGSTLIKKAVTHSNSGKTVPFNILTLSGGGTTGAYGVGLLYGWNKRGDIPKFDIVTGVSTGAVMAPFIFLGGKELENLKNFYTTSYTKDIYTNSWYNFFNGYILNPEPLKNTFSENFNKDFLGKVAAEHAKGRRLYVGTTNLDTGQLIVWDMGAIASSDRNDKYERFANIIYASSAMPVYLPPEYMSVDIDGKLYYQMHVDGGIYSHVFMIGLLVNWQEVLKFGENANLNFDTTLYTVANRKYRKLHKYSPPEQSPGGIINRYVNIKDDLLFDKSIYRLYDSCRKTGIKFRMAIVPKHNNFVDDSIEFDPEKMTKLFNVGYHSGMSGIKWQENISLDAYDNQSEEYQDSRNK